MAYKKYLSILFFSASLPAHAEPLSQMMSEVVTTITNSSYYPLNKDKATIKALDAFSRSIDEHTRFLGPQDYKKLLEKTDGSYWGIGIELSPQKKEDEPLVLVSIKPGSPAHHAGLKRYDSIIAIDGTPVGPLSLDEALKKLRGKNYASAVTLTLLRNNKVHEVTIKKENLSGNASWCAYLPDQKVLYCHISSFTHTLADTLRATLAKGLKKKPRGLILDLRDNSGGVLTSAVDCASLFLPPHSLIVSTKKKDGTTFSRYTTTNKPLVHLPIIILVNHYTASAAEILASALQIHAKKTQKVSPHIFIVGTQTYGKGSVQAVKPIGSDCALKITTALYYLPDNSCIQGTGVTPDIIIKQKFPESHEQKLLHALYGSEAPCSPKKQKKVPQDMNTLRIKALTKDHQILSACTIIQLIDIALKAEPLAIKTHDKAVSWLNTRVATHKLCKPVIIG